MNQLIFWKCAIKLSMLHILKGFAERIPVFKEKGFDLPEISKEFL